MVTRPFSRWIMPIALACFTLVTINLLLAKTPTQVRAQSTSTNQTRYVATTGSDVGNDCTNSSLPCATAQHAVDVVADQDEVRIAAGTYSDLNVRPRADVTTTGVVTQIIYLSKTVTIRGGYTTTNWLVSDPANNPTVLNAQAQGRVIYVTGNVSPTIEGLRLTRGDPLDMGNDPGCLPGQCLNVGGAVFAITTALTLDNSQIDNNSAGAYEGGAIFLKNANAHLSNNTVMNTAGSGISLLGSSAMISTSVIVSNTSSNGGGLLLKFSTATVNGNQILNNWAGYACGGGICMWSSIVTLTGNIIRDNQTGYNAHGAGVSAYYSTVGLYSNSIEYNVNSGTSTLGGGGIFLTNSDTTLIGNVIQSNVSTQVGGGISMVQGPNSAILVNNVIAENQSETMGGGLYIAGSSAHLVHNTFAHNASGDGSGIYATDFYYGPQYSTVALTNTIIFSQPVGLRITGGNTVTLETVLWYSTPITVAQAATGTIAAQSDVYGDPKFVDPLNGDYHLQFGSAAIDRGVNVGVYTDLDGNPRPIGLGFDIGAYEYTGGPGDGIRYVATTGNDASNDCLNGVNPCATIQHAIDVANDGEQVLIASGLYTQSATLSKPISLTGVNRDTTIIHAVAGQRVLTVTGATISNSVVISGLTFTGGQAGLGAGILITETAQPSVRNVAIKSNRATAYGGGLYAADALILSNTQLIDNWAYANGFGYGGGVYVIGTADIANTQFMSNVSPYGAGVYALGEIRITATDFISNLATQGAGVNAASAASIAGGQFVNNLASGGGGSAVAADHALSITGTHYISNSASEEGGAVIAFNGPVTIADAQFIRNRTTFKSGGAVYVLSGTLAIRQSQFSSNTAYANGGGLFASDATTLTHVVFVSNVAAFGGSIFSTNNLTVFDSQFIGNQCVEAKCGGGALLAERVFPTQANLVISNTQFIENAATTSGSIGGAVYYGGYGAIYVVNTLFAHNAAQQYGASLFLNWGEVANFDFLTIVNDTLNPVAALTVYSHLPVAINNSIIVSHAIGIQNLAGGVLAGHNLFFGNTANTTGAIGGGPNFVGDPKFVDPLHDDYHLQFGSAAIDRGVNVGVYTDLDGKPRPKGLGFDIGAYEYQSIRYLWLPLIRKAN